MAGGQAITSAQGSVIALGGEGDEPLTGSAATSAAGTPALNRLLPLRSRKQGTGTASAVLAGHASVGGTGTLVHQESFALVGIGRTLAQGTLLYRGRVLLAWDAATDNVAVTGYRVKHGTTNGGPYPDVQDVGNVLTYQWDGLLPGFTHYFVVTAYDAAANESSVSNQLSRVF